MFSYSASQQNPKANLDNEGEWESLRGNDPASFLLLHLCFHARDSRATCKLLRFTTSGRFQHRNYSILGLPVKSDESDWLRMQNEYSAHSQKMGYAEVTILGADQKGSRPLILLLVGQTWEIITFMYAFPITATIAHVFKPLSRSSNIRCFIYSLAYHGLCLSPTHSSWLDDWLFWSADHNISIWSWNAIDWYRLIFRSTLLFLS